MGTFFWALSGWSVYFSYYIVPTGIPFLDLTTSSILFGLLSLDHIRQHRDMVFKVSHIYIEEDGKNFFFVTGRGRLVRVPIEKVDFYPAGIVSDMVKYNLKN